MKKIKVLQLAGCSWCKDLTSRLYNLDIQYQSIDADVENNLADRIESFLNTTYYPIVIAETDRSSIYIYRPSNAEDIGIQQTAGNKVIKIGCLTIDDMISQILDI
jgi:hypothetical protein